MGRTVLAALAGAVAMFIWFAVAHQTALGQIGIKEAPKGSAAVASLAGELKTGGFYMFPGSGVMTATGAEQQAAMKAQEEESKVTGWGILIYNAPDAAFQFGPALAKEFATDLIQALVLALVIAGSAAATFGRRVGLAGLLGVGAMVSTNASYMTWYGFPLAYTLAYMFIELVGYVVAGAAIAAVLGWRGKAASA